MLAWLYPVFFEHGAGRRCGHTDDIRSSGRGCPIVFPLALILAGKQFEFHISDARLAGGGSIGAEDIAGVYTGAYIPTIRIRILIRIRRVSDSFEVQ